MGDYYYLYLLGTVAVMIASFIVQGNLKRKAAQGSQIRAASGKTANQIVEEMLREHGVTGLSIEHKPGQLTDCYSPREGKIYLSDTTYNQSSITAIAVAAHECGHAIQDHENMLIYEIRQKLAPIAGICSQAGVWLAVIGLAVAQASSGGGALAYNICNLGILVYMGAFLFYLVMLPVERDASRRAYKDMKQAGWVGKDQEKFAYKVLRAAGDTYAIALASAAVTLLRLLTIRNSANRRR